MTDKEITALNLKSATYYGAHLQMNHFTEELAELIQAVVEENKEHITEEIADVEVMVEQMEHLLMLNRESIEGWAVPDNNINADNILSCVWHLAQPIKYINKWRRVRTATAADPNMTAPEVYYKRKAANDDLENSIGGALFSIGWLKEEYNIQPDEIKSVKSYKVQRTRDRIELEIENAAKSAAKQPETLQNQQQEGQKNG